MLNNNYWLNQIDPSIKEVNGISIGDKFQQLAPPQGAFEANLEVIGFDDAKIPIVKYSKVKYPSDYVCTSKYGKDDLYKDGDIFCYIGSLKKLIKIK